MSLARPAVPLRRRVRVRVRDARAEKIQRKVRTPMRNSASKSLPWWPQRYSIAQTQATSKP
eukprot:4621844-Pyramimonas_sp.AAC.2